MRTSQAGDLGPDSPGATTVVDVEEARRVGRERQQSSSQIQIPADAVPVERSIANVTQVTFTITEDRAFRLTFVLQALDAVRHVTSQACRWKSPTRATSA
jgi:thiamine biosynthesis protein ThiC